MPTPVKEAGPILVLNSGSSSLKFGVFRHRAEEEELLVGSAEEIGHESGTFELHSADGHVCIAKDHVLESQQQALQQLANAMPQYLPTPLAGIGHRIVHGGPHLREHQLITPDVLVQLEAAIHFAPLHIPQALALIQQAANTFPNCPQYACFDTSFHRTMPQLATHLPLPTRYFDQGLIRYGFHGLSYESIVYRIGSSLPPRAIFAHLGNGSSVVAVRNGKSIDTSMGLTPTGGVPMGTRSGDLDPGVLLYLMRSEAMDADTLETLLNHECGLAAFSGGESDMQILLQRATAGDAPASLAVDAFTTAVRKTIGSYAALMGGVDLLVFTGGIGQHSAAIRDRICQQLAFLGLTPGSDKVQVLPTDEERQIARHCRSLLTPG